MEPPKAQRYLRAAAGSTNLMGALTPFESYVAARESSGPRLSVEQEGDLRESLHRSGRHYDYDRDGRSDRDDRYRDRDDRDRDDRDRDERDRDR